MSEQQVVERLSIASSGERDSLFARGFRSLRIAYERAIRPRRTGISDSLVPPHAGIAMALFVIVIAALFVVDGTISYNLRRSVYGSADVYYFFRSYTHVGRSSWILLTTLVVGLYLSVSHWNTYPRRQRLKRISLYEDVNFVFFTVAISGGLIFFIKNFLGRGRPRMQEELGALHFNIGAFDSDFASFPSGHSTTMGAICMALILLLPKYWPVWLAFGFAGALSRFMVWAHYVSDVVAGVAIGATLILLAARWLALRGVMFTFTGGWLPKRKR